MRKRAAVYIRVSTDGQTTENQRRELQEVASRSGWKVIQVYEDAGISGTKGRDKRPAFDRLCKDATRRKFDVIMAWSVDRLGRSLQDLVVFLNELRGIGVDLFLHKQGMNTTTPAGRMLFQMCGVFAEFEHAMIRERVMSGLERAKSEGKTLGRPKVSPKVEHAIRKARLNDPSVGMIKLAKRLGVGVSVVQRVLAPA
jgi:DNA invertase Pin-like site-specific DNA recombinase